MRLSIFLALGLTIALVAAVPASAGTVCSAGGVSYFYAGDVAAGCAGGVNGPGEVNNLTVGTGAGGKVTFADTNPITDGDGGGGCDVTGNTAICPAEPFTFDLGDQNDKATIGAAASAGTSTGGDGNDQLTGGPHGP
jgi:hypothetical protein